MLRISNLSFSYHTKEIFSHVSLSISAPQKIAVIGDNGSGKTTLLKLIAGILRPDDGAIHTSSKIGYLPQIHDQNSNKSGGEKTKLALEKLLAKHYDILLLDEPTNNLDSTTRAWLLKQLQTFNGLVLIISHDRYFIDQIAEQILEISSTELKLTPGNYHDYTARKEQHRAEQQQQYDKAQRAKRKLQRHLDRAQNLNQQADNWHFDKIRDNNKSTFRYWRNNIQVSMGKIIRASKTQLDQLEQVEKPFERKTYQAKISADFLRRRRLLKINELCKHYSEQTLFKDLSCDIYTSERYRILGKNGAGKTTLFKIILNELAPDSGNVKLAPNLKLGYISQEISGLNLAQSFLNQTDADLTEIFRAATTMDLNANDLKTPAGELSRGQITKLAFLQIILNPADLLILDEPTNHLDIRARENIENALINYPGAILLATHDEEFAKKLQIKNTLTLPK